MDPIQLPQVPYPPAPESQTVCYLSWLESPDVMKATLLLNRNLMAAAFVCMATLLLSACARASHRPAWTVVILSYLHAHPALSQSRR
jgi:hypothetical protein